MYLPAGRLAATIAADEYTRALYEGYRDGPQYDERPNLERYRRCWEQARAERQRLVWGPRG